MAVSACSRRLACTRRYVPADLKQRWLRQLQWATRKVCWGRKASCQDDFEHRLWLFLPDHRSTPCCVKVGKNSVLAPLGFLRVNPGCCGCLALLEPGWKEHLNQVWENLTSSRSVQCKRAAWYYYLMLIVSFCVEQSVYLSAYSYSFAESSLGWKWEGYSSAWGSTVSLRNPSS